MPRILLSNMADCARRAQQLLVAAEPCFLSRIGGSDTDLVVAFFDLLRFMPEPAALARLEGGIELVRRFNGYYDKRNDLANVARYCHVMKQAYADCAEVFLVGSTWLSAYLPDSINPQFEIQVGEQRARLEQFLRSVAPPLLRLYPYSFIERILLGDTLFRVFAAVLTRKRVVVVSPFARSIQANFPRRKMFFPNYAYPEFSLLTVDTPITYAGLPDKFYPHADWFETLDALKSELARQEFDIALLACGSYAMPLGRFIADQMRRKAIYVGGVLQLFFGVIGRRYDNPFFLSQINRDNFIYPLEREAVLPHVDIRPDTAREGLAAYF